MVIDGKHPLASYLWLYQDDQRLSRIAWADTDRMVAQEVRIRDGQIETSEVPFDVIVASKRTPKHLLALIPADIPVGRE